jgi:hypothetical protein
MTNSGDSQQSRQTQKNTVRDEKHGFRGSRVFLVALYSYIVTYIPNTDECYMALCIQPVGYRPRGCNEP